MRGSHLEQRLRQLLLQPVTQQAVFRHGKAVPIRQGQHKMVCVIGMHDTIVAIPPALGSNP